MSELVMVEQDSVVWGILITGLHPFTQVEVTFLPQPWYAATESQTKKRVCCHQFQSQEDSEFISGNIFCHSKITCAFVYKMSKTYIFMYKSTS